MCWLIRGPDVPSTVALGQRTPGRARCACPVVTGFRALAFHTLLSFQGASWNRPCDSPGGSPSQVPSPERRQPYSGPSRFVNRATYPLVLPGIPAVSLICTLRSVPEASPVPWAVTVETSGHPLVFPREPVAMPPQVHGADNGEPNPGIATRDLWRHLATSTSYRSAVLSQRAQDGHRSRRNSVPVAFGDLLSSVLAPSWRRRRGLGPRRTSLTWCAVNGSTAVENVSTSYPSNGKGLTRTTSATRRRPASSEARSPNDGDGGQRRGWDRDALPPDRPCMGPGRGSAQLPRLIRHAEPRRRRRASKRPSGQAADSARGRAARAGARAGDRCGGRVRRRRRGGAGERCGRR
jgi:hypothetical protein